MSEENARRRGRPRLPAEHGKRYPIAIRTTKELKERLERASAASGRSLAQEMEFRLERSFEVQDVADVVYPLIARISDQIGELGLFVISHNDPDHLNALMELLDADGLRARIESTRPRADGMAKVPGANELRAKRPRDLAAESDELTKLGRSKMAAHFSSRLGEASREIASRAVPVLEEKIEVQQLAQCRQDVEAFGRGELSLLDLFQRQPGLFNRGSAARPAHCESQDHNDILSRILSGDSGLCGGKASAARLRAGAAAARTDCEGRGNGER